MPGVDRIIDPLTGDYVPDGKGGWKTTTDLRTAVYHQLQGELDHWAGDPEAGCELYLLRRAKSDARTMLFAKDTITRALKPFVDLGLAAQLEVIVDRDSLDRLILRSSIHDVQHGKLDLTPLLPGGP